MSRSRVLNLANLQQFAAINVLSDPGYDPSDQKIPNCVAVILNWALEDGHTGHNVLHARYSAGFTPSTAAANAILAALTTGGAWTTLAAFLSSQTTLGAVQLRDLNTVDQPFIPSSSGGASGTSVSPSLPNEVAAVITLRTGNVGPANRGRVFVPGWATNALGAGNVVAAAAVTALQSWANTIPTALSGSQLQFAIGQHHRLSYTGSSGKLHPERPANTVLITSQTVRDNHWDSQRRRGLK